MREEPSGANYRTPTTLITQQTNTILQYTHTHIHTYNTHTYICIHMKRNYIVKEKLFLLWCMHACMFGMNDLARIFQLSQTKQWSHTLSLFLSSISFSDTPKVNHFSSSAPASSFLTHSHPKLYLRKCE